MAKEKTSGKASKKGQDTSPLATLIHHDRPITALAFSSDGRTLVSGSNDNGVERIALWDVADGQRCGTLGDHAWEIVDIVFSPDGKLVATVSRRARGEDETRVVLWNLITRRWHHLKSPAEMPLHSPAFSPDSGRLALLAEQVWLFDPYAAGEPDELRANVRGESLAFSPDGRYLAIGDKGGPIHIWDVKRGKRLRTLEGHRGPVCRLAFSADGQTLASASLTQPWRGKPDPLMRPDADSALRFWYIAKGTPLGKPIEVGPFTSHLTLLDDGVNWLSFDAEGERGTIRRGKVGHLESVSWSPEKPAVRAAAVTKDGSTLATGNEDGLICLWNAKTVWTGS